jgi:Uma2 family endonuclease
MATMPLQIPVEEYLRTVYRPDCDYIDGKVLERKMGDIPHARLQTFFARFFAPHEDEWHFEVLTEQRLQTGAKNYRVPDLMLARFPNLEERIIRTPPLLCIEVLSSDDWMLMVQERIDDYARIGVPASWIVDPWLRVTYQADGDGVFHRKDREEGQLTVPDTDITISVAAIWAELDRLEKRAARKA